MMKVEDQQTSKKKRKPNPHTSDNNNVKAQGGRMKTLLQGTQSSPAPKRSERAAPSRVATRREEKHKRPLPTTPTTFATYTRLAVLLATGSW